MAIIKKYSSFQNLGNYKTFIQDTDPNSEFFRVTEFNETFTGGKNGFLIEGTPHLKETTEIKIEILDVQGNTVYFEPGNGIPEYYEGNSILVAVHVYDDTPIGIAQITILGEAKTYETDAGLQDIPDEWKGLYNVKWQKKFKINKLLSNEDKVRFYKRPLVSITEIAKSIFSVTTPTITQSGSVVGIPNLPAENTNLSNWTAGTNYRLKIVDDTSWTSSISENIISISGLSSSYEPTVLEVLNNKELLVDVPYTVNGMVKSFGSSSYVSTFEYLEGQTLTNSSLTGSFAKIDISRLKTFVGDVARVKIFRKSRNDVGDYQLTQDTKLESTELLRDLTIENKTQISYGLLTEYNLLNYWVTSSADHPVSINVDKLLNSMFIDYNTGAGGIQKIETVNYVPISSGVEYTLSFKTRFVGTVSPTKSIRAYLSSSSYTQEFTDFNSSDRLTSVTSISNNILATTSSLAKLIFEVEGDDWYISNISLRNAQDTSFSPDEFTLVQSIPRNLPVETFDFRFEFYDINNNYIPVNVFASKEFNGGNLSTSNVGSGSAGADGIDGIDSLYFYLTQPTHTFNVPSSSGYVGINYSSSLTETRVFRGNTQCTYEPYVSGANSLNTYSVIITDYLNNINPTGSATGSDYFVNFTEITGDYGYLDILIRDNDYGIQHPLRYSFGVSRAGNPGTSGSDGVSPVSFQFDKPSLIYVSSYSADPLADWNSNPDLTQISNNTLEVEFYKNNIRYTVDDSVTPAANTYKYQAVSSSNCAVSTFETTQLKIVPSTPFTAYTGSVTAYVIDNDTGLEYSRTANWAFLVNGASGSITGSDGYLSTSGYVYYQSASDTPPDPNPPSATSYTFSTFSFTGLTTDWSKTPPIATAGGKYWVSVFNVKESSPGTDTGIPTFTSASNSLQFSDIVTFVDLTTSGSTVINGDNITTGILRSANYVEISGSNYSLTGTEIDMTQGRITSPTFFIDGIGAGGLGGWSFSEGEIFKDEIRINSNRPAIEIYDSTGDLKVDINSSNTLTPYSASAGFVPSASTITSGMVTYGPFPSTPIGGYVQASLNGTITGSVSVTFEVTAQELGKTATVSANHYQDVGNPYVQWALVSGTLSWGNMGSWVGFRVVRPDGTYVTALYNHWRNTTVGGWINESTPTLVTLDLNQLGTYTIIPTVSNLSFGGYAYVPTSVSVTARTPFLTDISISASINKTEIIAGGFQVVKDEAAYFRIDRNTANTAAQPFIVSKGAWNHNGVILTTSDTKQKSNIIPITFDLKELKNINGYTYDLNLIPFKDKNKYTPEEYDKFKYKATGIIADEIENLLPNSVTTEQATDVKFVDYHAVTALLLNIVKQLYEEIEKLKPPTP